MTPLLNALKVYGASYAYQGLVPQNVNNTNVTGTYISVVESFHVMVACIVGVLNTNSALTFQVLQGQTTSGTNAKNLTGKNTTFAATADNTTKIIEFSPGELDVANSFDCVAVKCTNAGADDAFVAAITILGQRRFADATQSVA